MKKLYRQYINLYVQDGTNYLKIIMQQHFVVAAIQVLDIGTFVVVLVYIPLAAKIYKIMTCLYERGHLRGNLYSEIVLEYREHIFYNY